MSDLHGKHFSITDQKNVNTVIYQLNRTKREYLDKYPKYTLERLDCTSEFVGELSKKTFYVREPRKNGNELIVMSFGSDNVIINNALLIGNEVRVGKKASRFRYDTINTDRVEYREINYTPNMKRAITVIDIETTEEVTPNLYFDEKTNEVKGKCKLKPNKSYFAFEIRDI